MARLTQTFTCDESFGRDSGKAFFITEMPAEQSEDWGCRALLAMVNAGVKIPASAQGMGMMAIASSSLTDLTKGVSWTALKPLLNELMECVQYIPDPKNTKVMRELIADDIEEPLTRLKLKKEVFMMHISFFLPGDQ
jgi:hypothetical protein